MQVYAGVGAGLVLVGVFLLGSLSHGSSPEKASVAVKTAQNEQHQVEAPKMSSSSKVEQPAPHVEAHETVSPRPAPPVEPSETVATPKHEEVVTTGNETAQKPPEVVEPASKPREVSIDIGSGIKMDLVLIPAGAFEMGTNTGSKIEKPAHRVRITKPFYMGKYPVTKLQYTFGKMNCAAGDKQEPIAFLDAGAGEKYCAKLSEITHKTFRLPTEAEWEYACRAGTKTRFYSGDADADLEQCAWYKANSGGKLHPVGQKKPNAFGLYDMHGNVWQWCHDFYGDDYYAKSPVDDPPGPSQGPKHVCRGGSYVRDPQTCTASCRAYDFGWPELGFRVVMVAPDAP
jgi:formylglycine-generating enzyme required for sulfatase activity